MSDMASSYRSHDVGLQASDGGTRFRVGHRGNQSESFLPLALLCPRSQWNLGFALWSSRHVLGVWKCVVFSECTWSEFRVVAPHICWRCWFFQLVRWRSTVLVPTVGLSVCVKLTILWRWTTERNLSTKGDLFF